MRGHVPRAAYLVEGIVVALPLVRAAQTAAFCLSRGNLFAFGRRGRAYVRFDAFARRAQRVLGAAADLLHLAHALLVRGGRLITATCAMRHQRLIAPRLSFCEAAAPAFRLVPDCLAPYRPTLRPVVCLNALTFFIPEQIPRRAPYCISFTLNRSSSFCLKYLTYTSTMLVSPAYE